MSRAKPRGKRGGRKGKKSSSKTGPSPVFRGRHRKPPRTGGPPQSFNRYVAENVVALKSHIFGYIDPEFVRNHPHGPILFRTSRWDEMERLKVLQLRLDYFLAQGGVYVPRPAAGQGHGSKTIKSVLVQSLLKCRGCSGVARLRPTRKANRALPHSRGVPIVGSTRPAAKSRGHARSVGPRLIKLRR